MRQLLNSKKIYLLTLLLILATLAKFVSMVVLYNLPKSGVEVAFQNVDTISYKGYKTASIFGLVDQKRDVKKALSQETLKIDNFLLIALYGEKSSGFIVFAESRSPNNALFLSMNKEHKGYKLVEIKLSSAILEKDGKAYELFFKETPNSVALQKRVSVAQPKQKVSNDGDVVRAVTKKDVMYYAKNFDAIWKNIAIKEVVKSGKISGFKVLSVNKSSIFSQLGLQKGDIITSVNNKPLKSYADAFNIYNNIKDYESLKIDIVRNKQKKELEYEIF